MAANIYQLHADEAIKGQSCIDTLWQKGHILARDAELFKWQFRSVDQSNLLNFFIAADDNQPIGCMGRISLPCHRQGQPFPGAAMTNLICLPHYRKLGFGMQIMQKAYEGLQYVANIGINDHVAKLYRMMGQYIKSSMPRFVCIANMDILKGSLSQSAHSDKIKDESYFDCNTLYHPASKGGKICELESSSPDKEILLEDWEACWRRSFAPKLQGVIKDASYIRWRYLEHPRFHYTILLTKDSSGTVKGLAVMRSAPLPAGACAVRILEFLATDSRTGQDLAAAIAERIPPNTAFIEHIALGNQWLPLKEIGLSSRGNNLLSVYFNPPDLSHCTIKAAFYLKNIGLSAEDFICSDNTYITIADCDQDRPN